MILEAAEAAEEIVVLVDDAYYNLFYDETAIQESIFSKLAQVHDRVLCVKIDGATKENYAWGFRVGFITYSTKSEKALRVLEEKTKGLSGERFQAPRIRPKRLCCGRCSHRNTRKKNR